MPIQDGGRHGVGDLRQGRSTAARASSSACSTTTNTAFNIGVNFTPTDHVAFGANYGRDNFTAFQKSRNANPPPDPTWTDPNRDWTMDNDEKVNNFDLYLDLLNAFKNTDIRFAYTFSDSDNAFLLGGPRIATLVRRPATLDGLRDVRSAAERDQHLAAVHGGPEVLLLGEGRLRRRVLLREARHQRLRHDRTSAGTPGRQPQDRLPGRADHRLRQPAVQRQHRSPRACSTPSDGVARTPLRGRPARKGWPALFVAHDGGPSRRAARSTPAAFC